MSFVANSTVLANSGNTSSFTLLANITFLSESAILLKLIAASANIASITSDGPSNVKSILGLVVVVDVIDLC